VLTAVATAAVSPVTSLRVASSYSSRFSSYVSSCCQLLYQTFFSYVPSCCQFLYKLFLQSRPFVLPIFIPAVSPVTSLRVASFLYQSFLQLRLPVSSSNTSRFSSHVSSCYQVLHQPFLQLPLFVVTGQVP